MSPSADPVGRRVQSRWSGTVTRDAFARGQMAGDGMGRHSGNSCDCGSGLTSSDAAGQLCSHEASHDAL
jgi:hypothetical protein